MAGDGSTSVVSSATGVASLSVVAPDLFKGTIVSGSTPTASGPGLKLLEVRPVGCGQAGDCVAARRAGNHTGWVIPVGA